jgi:CBS domain containing-hemolysin-like protein
MTLFFLGLAVALLLLNAFFVLAEFAAVKMRPSRIEELIDAKVRGATAAKDIHDGLDDYLSVCQLGITFASIGLGFVAEPAIVRLIEPVVQWSGILPESSTSKMLTTHGIAFTISYAIVSYLHILVGELVPKSIAIRLTDKASLYTAPVLKVFYVIFFVPLRGLTASANLLLRLCGIPYVSHGAVHSEDELRILLNKGQTEGMMTFRRLLFLENVFDLGELTVRDAMRPRSQVRTLDTRKTWLDNMGTIRRYRFTRYPLIVDDPECPVGLVHLKDLFMTDIDDVNLQSVARPFITVSETALLETLLADMQRKRIHAALVKDSEGVWTGFLTLEDAIEEIIGTIRDEFEDEEHIHLTDALSEDRVQLGLESTNTVDAIKEAIARMPDHAFPISKEIIVRGLEEREKAVETYLGNHFGMPHARIAGLAKPLIMVLRSTQGIQYRNSSETADLLIVLLTPAGQPRVHQRLQAIVATIMDESEFIPQRLRTATTPAEVVEILLTGEQATLD